MRRKPLAALLGFLAFSVAWAGLVAILPLVSAAPAYVNSWSAGFGSVSTGSVTVATTGGDTVVVNVGTKVSTCTVSGVSDNGAGPGSTYSLKVGPVANTVDFEIWVTGVGAAKAATSVKVNVTGGPCKIQIAVADYSGVTAYGNTHTLTGSTANPSDSLTIQDTNGALAGGYTTNDATAPTAGTGNLRQAPCSTGGSTSTRSCSSLIDRTSLGAGAQTYSETHAAIAWAGGAVELRNQATLISVSCTDSSHPLTMNRTWYVQGITNYVRLSCTADGSAYTTNNAIVATPTFTLPAPFTELWSFAATTATGTTCAGGTNAWQMTSGSAHTFPTASSTWDYCAVIPSTATADSTSFEVAWNA